MKRNTTARRPSSSKSRRQAAIWCAAAVVALVAMILLFNPWKADTGSKAASPASSHQTQPSSSSKSKKTGKKTAKPAGTLRQQARRMFDGDAERIANDVRDLLNSPQDSNVDTLSNLLYRHDRQDLAEATDLYDAIGRQEDIDTIRSLARDWYPKAMQAAIDARREDLSSGLASADKESKRIEQGDLSATDGCDDLKGAYETAKRLVDSGSQDYDALTGAQQDLTAAVSGCATNLGPFDRAKVFGSPQGSLGKE